MTSPTQQLVVLRQPVVLIRSGAEVLPQLVLTHSVEGAEPRPQLVLTHSVEEAEPRPQPVLIHSEAEAHLQLAVLTRSVVIRLEVNSAING